MRNCRHRFHKILFPAGALVLLTGALLTLLLPAPMATGALLAQSVGLA